MGPVATTLAHEMGHNFGLTHDTDTCGCPDDRCIMAPSSGFVILLLIGEQSIVMSASVCLSVCLVHILRTTRLNFTKLPMFVTCVRGSVPLWQHLDTLCISGFVDNVIFLHY